jgi:hypothetical protein
VPTAFRDSVVSGHIRRPAAETLANGASVSGTAATPNRSAAALNDWSNAKDAACASVSLLANNSRRTSAGDSPLARSNLTMERV